MIAAGLTTFVTVHDSVILPEQFADKAQDIINNEFKILGITPPKIKPDNLN